MMKGFNEDWRGIVFGESDFQRYTNYSWEKWVELTGILEPGFATIEDFESEVDYPVISIRALKSRLFRFSMRCNVEEKTININLCSFATTGTGRGLRSFNRMVKQGLSMGFGLITCKAKSGLSKSGVHFNGYITWAKLGFTMSPKSHQMFQNHMKFAGRKETSLQELLKTEDGMIYWINLKEKWDAEFYLTKGLLDDRANDNMNLKLLRAYTNKKINLGAVEPLPLSICQIFFDLSFCLREVAIIYIKALEAKQIEQTPLYAWSLTIAQEMLNSAKLFTDYCVESTTDKEPSSKGIIYQKWIELCGMFTPDNLDEWFENCDQVTATILFCCQLALDSNILAPKYKYVLEELIETITEFLDSLKKMREE